MREKLEVVRECEEREYLRAYELWSERKKVSFIEGDVTEKIEPVEEEGYLMGLISVPKVGPRVWVRDKEESISRGLREVWSEVIDIDWSEKMRLMIKDVAGGVKSVLPVVLKITLYVVLVILGLLF
jgi:hypothetical protein